jgi:Ca2+-binding EF-hand superfamily protein
MYFDNKNLKIEDENMNLLYNKANELFQICDEEQKGFLIKKDMQKMKNIVNLTPEVLEDVFDLLDQEKNGYLTLDEFINRFKDFKTENIEEVGNEKNEEDEIFKETIDALGASNILEE